MTTPLKKIATGVFVSTRPFKSIDQTCLDEVGANAASTKKLRARICCHSSVDHSPQEMIISLKPGTYIRPHRHHGKSESGLCLRGIADAVFFNEDGSISDAWPMAPESSEHRFFYRIEEPVFHCLVLRNEDFVFHEVSTGPFRHENTEFAPWSPDENDSDAVTLYLTALRRQIDEFARLPGQ